MPTLTHHRDSKDAQVLPDCLRVLVVGESALTRRMLVELLSAEQGVEVVGRASAVALATRQIQRQRPNTLIFVLDVPETEGMAALEQLRKQFPALRVIVLSSPKNAIASAVIRTAAKDPSDCCLKPPEGKTAEESRELLRQELMPKLRRPGRPRRGIVHAEAIAEDEAAVLLPLPVSSNPLTSARTLRPKTEKPSAVVIGISTGGPQALGAIIPTIPAAFPLPILIVQHMPASFTRLLAQRLNGDSAIEVEEATDGHVLRPGLALIAPGGFHMRVEKRGNEEVAVLDQGPPENSCRPAVDVLFRSAADLWGGNVLVVVLTGMGQDGLRGARVLKELGATVLAQDEQSSVVWGMPGSVVNAGLADKVLNLNEVVPSILHRIGFQQ